MERGVAQMEGVRESVVALFPALSQSWLKRGAIGRDADQLIVDQKLCPDAHIVGNDNRVEALDVIIRKRHRKRAAHDRL